MIWFGDLNLTSDSWMNESSFKAIVNKRLSLSRTSVDSIITLLDGFSVEWKRGSRLYNEAIPRLIDESGFTKEEVEKTLSLLSGLLSRESLERRVKAEFIEPEVLNEFKKTPHFLGKVKASPLGVILHVTAGNVFLSSIDSLIMGFLTKNLSIVKVSGQNKFFPEFFARNLLKFDQKNLLADKFAILHWKGGSVREEEFLKTRVNAIIAWGGEEMIESYRKNLPSKVKFLDFGPKISLQVISREGLLNKDLKNVSEKIVQDIIPWDQGACASPQNLYLQEGLDESLLLQQLNIAFNKAPNRGTLSDDEAVEILKETYRGYYSELMEGGNVHSGKEHLLHLEKSKTLRPSPLHRSLIIKRFKDEAELLELLEPFSYYLQSCSYLLGENEKANYLEALSLTGLKRFAPLGTITWGMEGAPHDGRFVLRELVSFIGDEIRLQDYGEKVSETTDSSELKKHFETLAHPEGYIFSSGGTTGEPKFVHFSNEEFDYVTDMLAMNFIRQGIKRGMTVANLFVAGNLWSSFMAVEKALVKIGAVQLPIGGLSTPDNIALYLKKFRPQVVMGIPSMLVMNAEYLDNQGHELDVPMVFYAGEALSEMRMDYLRKCWNTKFFGSAGYASVDAGVIGYQCEHSGPGEHHVFSDLVNLKIVNEEAVVTSLYRTTLPIKNYRTGDKVEWISDCKCGRPDPRFKLMGRVDQAMLIWSCRMQLTDIESSLKEMDSTVHTFQVVISESREANLTREKMEIYYEKGENQFSDDDLLREIYESSRDLRDTIKFQNFLDDSRVVRVDPGMIPRNPRTGKISLIVDRRR